MAFLHLRFLIKFFLELRFNQYVNLWLCRLCHKYLLRVYLITRIIYPPTPTPLFRNYKYFKFKYFRFLVSKLLKCFPDLLIKDSYKKIIDFWVKFFKVLSFSLGRFYRLFLLVKLSLVIGCLFSFIIPIIYSHIMILNRVESSLILLIIFSWVLKF
jgi:hypothetical protein